MVTGEYDQALTSGFGEAKSLFASGACPLEALRIRLAGAVGSGKRKYRFLIAAHLRAVREGLQGCACKTRNK